MWTPEPMSWPRIGEDVTPRDDADLTKHGPFPTAGLHAITMRGEQHRFASACMIMQFRLRSHISAEVGCTGPGISLLVEACPNEACPQY